MCVINVFGNGSEFGFGISTPPPSRLICEGMNETSKKGKEGGQTMKNNKLDILELASVPEQ